MKVKLRTKEYEVASLTFAEVERFATDGTLDKVPAPDNAGVGLFVQSVREAVMAVLLAALKPGHPEITREEIAGELDCGNAARAVAAVMGISRIERKEPGAGEG